MTQTDVERNRLRQIKSFPSLVKYLRDDLGWPIESDDFEEISFDYTAEELGIDAKTAAKIQEIKQLRPLTTGQPWGIFFVKFEPKRLPVVALRRILGRLVMKKRASASQSDRAAWDKHDLLFISNYGEGDERQLTFAHFTDNTDHGDLPTLKVLGWDDQDTALHLDDVHGKLHEKLAWPADAKNLAQWRERWRAAFELRHREVITTSKQLALRLADLAKDIRKRCNAALRIETEKGPLTTLMTAFKQALIHDLKPDDFADMYAQTIAYGLLSARVSRPAGLIADNLADMVPVTNPFLKELMQTFLNVGGRRWNDPKGRITGIDFDELGINEVVDTLREANMEAVLRDFGRLKPEEDPVIHFYEDFIREYDRQKKNQRGVFYTPKPVVSYIVRSVHEILQTEFGLADGLADTTTWAEMLKKHANLKLPEVEVVNPQTRKVSKKPIDPATPFVQILDPATGTATFLVEVIDVIYKTMTARWKKQRLSEMYDFPRLWNEYVPKHLLPRLHGYELMMAPYAIAHMKLGLKLFETGYKFGSGERARIYLTNALEPPHDFSDTFEQMAPALAHEAQAVNDVKRHRRFTVVVGNPPYSGLSANMGAHAQALVGRYRHVDGQPLEERKLWLQNDYVKFIALAHEIVRTSGRGCIGYITDASYLAGPTFRGMRSNILRDFNRIDVFHLHGGTKTKSAALAAGGDENVFDITQAVCILHAVRSTNAAAATYRYLDLVGSRSSKYDRLDRWSWSQMLYKRLAPTSPYFLFVDAGQDDATEYLQFSSINVFPTRCIGVQTSRDHLAIGFTKEELIAKVERFIDPEVGDAAVREMYFPGKKVRDYLAGDTRGWSLSKARRALRKMPDWQGYIDRIHYRPFDFRYILNSTLLVDWPRPEISEHMKGGHNLALCVLRRTENVRPYDYFSVSRVTISNHQASLKDGTYLQ